MVTFSSSVAFMTHACMWGKGDMVSSYGVRINTNHINTLGCIGPCPFGCR